MAPLQNNTPMTVKEKQDRRDLICIRMEAASRPRCGDRPSTTVFKENKTAYGCHKGQESKVERTEPADEDKDYVKVDEVKDDVKVDEDKDYVKVDENADFVEVDVDEMEMSDWEEI